MNKSESKYFNTALKMDRALIDLLKKKQLEYITVSELCKAAGVNRSTFYLHYETIGDLLEETTRYMLDVFVSYFSDDKKSIAFNLSDCRLDDLNFINDTYLIPYLTYIKENKELFRVALSEIKVFGFEDVYNRLFENIFNPILERFNYPQENRKYVMLYYLNGINAVNLEWLKGGCEKPMEEIAQIIKVCILGRNSDLLNPEAY